MSKQPISLQFQYIPTPLGDMLAMGFQETLYFLDFIDSKNFLYKQQKILKHTKKPPLLGNNQALLSIHQELSHYFSGDLSVFQTPLFFYGTPFQQTVWDYLKKIPYGKTISYYDQSHNIGKPNSTRAVANANAVNNFSIVIPCHRVVKKDGSLGGYAGGCHKKQWLINHEKQHIHKHKRL